MFISPIRVIQEGWITHPECKTLDDWKARKFVSPNAIDFTCDVVKVLDSNSDASINDVRSVKQMRCLNDIEIYTSNPGVWKLRSGNVYDCMSDMYVSIPPGYVALLFPRSTLTRNGLFMANGIFDTGFHGNIGTSIHVPAGNFSLAKGTRIGQIAFFKAEDSGIVYAGGYNTQPGQHWASK